MFDDLVSMSLQEIFDTVASHLLTQNQRSVGYWVKCEDSEESFFNDTSCAYRGQNGLKCAVGVLISDQDYSPQIEGESIRCLMGTYQPNLDHLKREVIRTLQFIHDNHSPKDWGAKLKHVAKTYNLEYKGVETDEVLQH